MARAGHAGREQAGGGTVCAGCRVRSRTVHPGTEKYHALESGRGDSETHRAPAWRQPQGNGGHGRVTLRENLEAVRRGGELGQPGWWLWG